LLSVGRWASSARQPRRLKDSLPTIAKVSTLFLLKLRNRLDQPKADTSLPRPFQA